MLSMPSSRTLLEYRGRMEFEATCSTPVKNTFVHYENSVDGRQEAQLARKEKRFLTAPQLQTVAEAAELADTTASFSMSSALVSSLCASDAGEDSNDDDSPCLPHLSRAVSGLSDADTFESTPTGSECDFSADLFAASSSVRRYLHRDTELTLGAFGSASKDVLEQNSKQANEVSGRQVLVQVPMTLPADIHVDGIVDCGKAAIERVLQSGTVSGETIFDVKLRLCIPCVGRTSPRPLLLAEAVPAPPVAAPKSVCCHWKNKGWCAYKDTCKFLHPENRRGVGSIKAAMPTRTRGGNRHSARVATCGILL